MTWITVKQVACILGVTEMAVRKNVYKGKYQYQYAKGKGGNSGKVLQIALESLPQSAQDAYNRTEKPLEQANYLSDFTGAQREAAERKCGIVRIFQSSGISGKRFVDDYNSKNS